MIRKFLIISLVISIFQILFCQQGWYQLTSGTSNNLKSVYFTDVNTGYAGGFSGTIIKTTNGGINWISYSGLTTENLNSVHFIGQTGFLVGGISSPVIIKTTNAGINWVNVPLTGNYRLNSVFMTDTANVHSCGGGKIIRTTNGGLNWNVQNFDSAAINVYRGFRTIFFTDAMNGFAGGYTLWVNHYLGLFMITNNGGVSWYQASSQTFHTSIYFTNTATGYGSATNGGPCCPANYIIKTTTGGSSWSYIEPVGSNKYFNSIRFVNSTTGYAAGFTSAGNSLIIKTSNTGINWFEQITPSTDSLNSIYFIDTNTGYAVGNAGTILKTTNGGATGLVTLSNEVPKEYKLYQNYPNPFNPNSKIKFQISKSGYVKLAVFDILGGEIKILVNEQLNPGTYEIDFDGANYSSGIYYYKLIAGNYSETKKMILIK